MENIPVFDMIAGIEDATKTLLTINSTNAFRFDCSNILNKSRKNQKEMLLKNLAET